MYNYDDEVLEVFLEKQLQLFPEEVADSLEAAEEFLEDCMAVVCKNLREVKEYFEEEGNLKNKSALVPHAMNEDYWKFFSDIR